MMFVYVRARELAQRRLPVAELPSCRLCRDARDARFKLESFLINLTVLALTRATAPDGGFCSSGLVERAALPRVAGLIAPAYAGVEHSAATRQRRRSLGDHATVKSPPYAHAHTHAFVYPAFCTSLQLAGAFAPRCAAGSTSTTDSQRTTMTTTDKKPTVRS